MHPVLSHLLVQLSLHGAEALVHAAGHAGRLGDGVGVHALGREEASLGLDLPRQFDSVSTVHEWYNLPNASSSPSCPKPTGPA